MILCDCYSSVFKVVINNDFSDKCAVVLVCFRFQPSLLRLLLFLLYTTMSSTGMYLIAERLRIRDFTISPSFLRTVLTLPRDVRTSVDISCGLYLPLSCVVVECL